MSDNIPISSVEYVAMTKREYFAPKVCKIISIDWCAGKNLMVSFIWNNQTRRANISKACRERFGKLIEEVRNSIIDAAPEAVTISTSTVPYTPHKRRLIHHIDKQELNSWLDSVKI